MNILCYTNVPLHYNNIMYKSRRAMPLGWQAATNARPTDRRELNLVLIEPHRIALHLGAMHCIFNCT